MTLLRDIPVGGARARVRALSGAKVDYSSVTTGDFTLHFKPLLSDEEMCALVDTPEFQDLVGEAVNADGRSFHFEALMAAFVKMVPGIQILYAGPRKSD